jgi:hypothetical protein
MCKILRILGFPGAINDVSEPGYIRDKTAIGNRSSISERLQTL